MMVSGGGALQGVGLICLRWPDAGSRLVICKYMGFGIVNAETGMIFGEIGMIIAETGMIMKESGMIIRNFGMISSNIGRTASKMECTPSILMDISSKNA
jgi:hypothetical protein